MTVEMIKYAQSLTKKPMKGMLTGPITCLQWSFVRNDQPSRDTAVQLALAIREEVADLEKAGIQVIQECDFSLLLPSLSPLVFCSFCFLFPSLSCFSFLVPVRQMVWFFPSFLADSLWAVLFQWYLSLCLQLSCCRCVCVCVCPFFCCCCGGNLYLGKRKVCNSAMAGAGES